MPNLSNLTTTTEPELTTLPIYTHDSLNFLFVSTEYCLTKNGPSYCNYAVFIILLAYITNLFVFPILLVRMRNLNKKFRNQYNISLLWLCSIFLMFSIDLIEFFLVADGHLYSVIICIILFIYLVSCGLTIFNYFRNYSIDGTFVRNVMTIFFTVCVFFIVFTGRYLSQKALTKYPDLDRISPISFHIINTHFFLYFFIYVLFAIVQVYQNLKNKFARCLTNLSYAAWVLGSFMLSFYSEVLPKRPAYDFIHYRNYFLMSTIIVIILQDINFIRERLYERSKNMTINSISLKDLSEIDANELKDKVGYDRDRQFLEEAFSADSKNNQGNNKHNGNGTNKLDSEEEEKFFDIAEYNLKGSKIITINPQEPETSRFEDNNIQISMKSKQSKLTEMQRIINNNQTRLIVLFVVILVCELIYITVQLFKSVTFSHFAIMSPLVHPLTFVFSLLFREFRCKM